MSRSVVHNRTPRCERCQLPHRWCTCAGFRPVECPLQVDVLIDSREYYRPTSTGRLINRVLPASRGHLYRHDLPLVRADITRPDRKLWILHPAGAPPPLDVDPASIQVLLLDGSWREAARMRQDVSTWGRLVGLPMTGASRYLLRSQQGTGRFSTIEALLFLLAALGLTREHAELRLQFELHVYAGLRARGQKVAAADFLQTSPVRDALPELVAEFDRRRPLQAPG